MLDSLMKSASGRIGVAFVAAALQMAGPANAGASIVLDVSSGKVLAQENAFQRWYPASLTKLMTAYIAMRALKTGQLTLTSPVKISANAAKQPPSRMGYKPGSVLTLDNALKIMLVKSANDIAVAVGETAGGKNYAELMNTEAQRLGMGSSHFVNANGLHSPAHYSSARDLAVLSFALRTEFPEYARYFGIEAISYGDHLERNYNILLGRFAGADGMKTGFVCASGFNIVASATRNGRTLVAVVLGEISQERRAEKAAALLSEGFASPSAAGQDLANMTAPVPANLQAVNMKSTVCSKQAASDRWDGRDVEGRMHLDSPYITAMTREPETVAVGLGGATGPGTTAIAANDNFPETGIPVPTPRPAYTPSNAAPMALTGDTNLRKGMPVPAASSN